MKRITIERVLLVLILALQVVLLVALRNGAVGGGATSVADRAAGVSLPSGTVARSGQQDEPSGPAFAEGTHRLMGAQRASLFRAQHMFDGVDALFEQVLADVDRWDSWFDVDDTWTSLLVSPMLDMRQDDDSYTVLFALPGLSPSGVGVLLDGRVVTIKASYDGRAARSRHLAPLTIERYVRLPGPVGDAADAAASLTNGVLRIHLPKGTPDYPLPRGARLF